MTWLIEILRIYPEERYLIKYYVIKHLLLQKIKNMMDTKASLVQQFIYIIYIFDKRSPGRAIKSERNYVKTTIRRRITQTNY